MLNRRPALSNSLPFIRHRPIVCGCVLVFAAATLLAGLSACLGQPAAAPPPTSIDLSRYTLAAGPIRLPEIAAEASDLVYSPISKTLFLVTNTPAAVHELTDDGRTVRRIDLIDFQDTEGITHIRDHLFALIEERRNTVALVDFSPDVRSIRRAEVRLISLREDSTGNKGPEGITYDPVGRRLLIVKERSPRGFYSVSNWESPASRPSTSALRLLPWEWREMADLSAIHHDLRSDHLLVLSDESRRLEERSRDGIILSHLALQRGRAGLIEDIPQPEGVALTPDGTLYICSEPNLLYIFTKPPRG